LKKCGATRGGESRSKGRRGPQEAKEENVKIYETMVLLDPEFAGKSDTAGIEHVTALIAKHGGEVIRCEKYADQRLAYEIKNRKRGIFVLAAFRMDPQAVTGLNRSFNLDDHVLRDLVLDRTGMTVDKFFKKYEAPENHAAAIADARAV
jgi:small subunit ribosomal protein S6